MYSTYQSFKQDRQPTPSDIEGPFFKIGAPLRLDLSENPNLTVEVKVSNTKGDVVVGATVDFWQADEKGNYDNETYNYRGKWVTTDKPFVIKTIVPGDYPIDENEFRCAHLHFMISAPGHNKLTTQLYFPDDKYNLTDHWFDPARVISHPVGKFEFILEKM